MGMQLDQISKMGDEFMTSARKAVVIVEGIIGAGKTTFAKELNEALVGPTLLQLEPDEKGQANPYLEDYYKDPGRWAYTMQTHLLQARFRMHLLAQWYALQNHGPAILDRSFYGDTAFAHLQLDFGLMSPTEYGTYASIYQAMTAQVLYPTTCIHLKVSSAVAASRIQSRMELETGRKCEDVISRDYLDALDVAIDRVIALLASQGVQIITLDWDANRQGAQDRAQMIQDVAAAIYNLSPPDLFTNIHSKVL